MPVPLATQYIGFSAIVDLTPTLLKISSGRLRKEEVPPVIMMPWSIMSEASSGGVSCKTSFMAFITSLNSFDMALTISLVLISIDLEGQR